MSYTIQRMPYQGCYRIWTFVWTGEKRSITPSGLVFFKYLNREKISVFKNIRIRVDETLVKIKSCWYEEIYHTL